MRRRRKIAITIGDPAGIGPEITLKSLTSREILGVCSPAVVGDKAVIEEAIERLKIPVNHKSFELIDVSEVKMRGFKKCIPTPAGGKACVSYIKKAVELALNKTVDAIVTAPISKESLKMAGFSWPGHTELLAELTNTEHYAMMLSGGPLKVFLVTIHAAIKDVPKIITKERVLKTIILAKKGCEMMDIKSPKIAVAGLNPHAGEAGIFGDEEIQMISPAVNEARDIGIPVSGPYPADILFHKAYRGEFDAVVCMYHDQGLIPLKMIARDEGVNVTIGLSIIRTSPDHGTAYDIAWKGTANPSSMIEAIKMAIKLGRK
ncbi:4-hydroxythreonine-4-phosphate dehydrogenase PdxA [Thermodesulfovibrionales bacterium]|nr:4-hydroxythreonine-4-phosphate dehydrogenase PdxA [Thermodesulfovibrionales bacterium]